MPGAQPDDPAGRLLDPDGSAALAASLLGEQAVAAFLAATRATPRAPLELAPLVPPPFLAAGEGDA